MVFKKPPLAITEAGNVRRVGFEIEFTGLTIERVIHILQSVFDGDIEKKSAIEYVLHTEEYGKFKVELDWEFLKNAASEANINDEGHEWVDFLHQIALSVVPLEIVSPPFALDDLTSLNQLITSLRAAGAKGTDDSVIAAFGVHINPELPSLNVSTIHAYMLAFGLLQWWLDDTHDVNIARKVSPYIQLYSQTYIDLLLSKSYSNITDLMDDYLAHNPSRNRALDMLPLFAFLNEDKIKAAVMDSKVNARPTLHYRLPDSLIEQENWSFANAWNIWYWVEILASDSEALNLLSQRFREMSLPVIGVKRNEWVQEINQWIKNRELG